MTHLNCVFLALLIVAALPNSGLLAQKGGRGNGRMGNQSGQTNQLNRGQQGTFQGHEKGHAGRGHGQSGQRQRGQGGGKGLGSGGALEFNERNELSSMREEEKLARDVYIALQKKWKATIFTNISRAESQHMKVLGELLEKYRIPDPIVNDTPGAFTSPKFQQLYGSLVDAGSTSLRDALKVGLKIEEMDIADLRRAIQSTDNNDLKRAYQNLERGSQNHLRAFSMQLKKLGGSYVATSLSQDDFDKIANSSMGQGGNPGRGGNQGRSGAGNDNSGQGRGNQDNSGRGNAGRGNAKGKGRGK